MNMLALKSNSGLGIGTQKFLIPKIILLLVSLMKF